jgi:hypothetical protein
MPFDCRDGLRSGSRCPPVTSHFHHFCDGPVLPAQRGCKATLIGRDWYELSDWNLTRQGTGLACGMICTSVFEAKPGHWGARRRPVFINTCRDDGTTGSLSFILHGPPVWPGP